MEECVLIDGDILNEIIIPTTNVDRLLPDGTRHKEEIINKSQIYITTAGWKNSFAYDKLTELLVQSMIEPDKVMVMGGTYETPVAEGLLDEDFVEQLKLQGEPIVLVPLKLLRVATRVLFIKVLTGNPK